jgi:hypothetical protein
VVQGAALRNAIFESGFNPAAEDAMREWALANPEAAAQIGATWLGIPNEPSVLEWAQMSVPDFGMAPGLGGPGGDVGLAPPLPTNPGAAKGLQLVNGIFQSNFSDSSFAALYSWARTNPDAAKQIPATWTGMGDLAPSVYEMALAAQGAPSFASTPGGSGSSYSGGGGFSGGGGGGGGGGGFRDFPEPPPKPGDSRNKNGRWEVYRQGQWLPQIQSWGDIPNEDRNLLMFALQTGASSLVQSMAAKYGLTPERLRLLWSGAGEMRMFPTAMVRFTA